MANARERSHKHFLVSAGSSFQTLTTGGRPGKILVRVRAKFGREAVGRGRVTNDALIAVSSKRLGITVVTANAQDFERLSRIRPFSWKMAGVA